MGSQAPRAPLDQAVIESKISQYWRVSVVELTGSTQIDMAARISSNSARPGDVIVAEYQSAGRGRLGRTFSAPATSALLFSLYIEPNRPQSEWGFLTLLCGLSVATALRSQDPRVEVRVKWPNDLIIAELKVGGLIAQAHGGGVIIGVGINVGLGSDELPVEHATSLSIHHHAVLDRNVLLGSILSQLESSLARWENGEDLSDEYRALSSTIGNHVKVEFPGGAIEESQALDILPTGELLLRSGTRVSVGDVIHLR